MRSDLGDARAWSASVQTTSFVGTPATLSGTTAQPLAPSTAPSTPSLVVPADADLAGGARVAPSTWLTGEAVAVAVLGVVTGLWLGLALLLVGWLTAASLAVVYVRRHTLTRPGRADLGSLTGQLALAYAVVALAVGGGLADRSALTRSAAVLALTGGAIAATTVARAVSRGVTRVVVVGDRSAISRGAMRWSAGDRVLVVGGVLVDDETEGEPEARSIAGVPTVTGLDDVARCAELWQADLVVVSPGRGVQGTDLRRLAWLLEDSPVGLALVDVADSAAPHRIRVASHAGATFVHLGDTAPSALVQHTKAAFDRVAGALLLVLVAPLLAVLIALVRLDSRGAGLFRQVRVGRHGEQFLIYKLRTMSVHAERDRGALLQHNEASGPLFKLHDDPRVTRVGHFLRRTSLDELPQLLNVVRGEMSLVGPRPALPVEVAEYDDVELRRLAVKPGMTGLWQVSGRSNLGWETGMALDLHYADNWRLVDDALICLRTVDAVVRGNGAY